MVIVEALVFAAILMIIGAFKFATGSVASFLIDSCKWIIANPEISVTVWLAFTLLLSFLICFSVAKSARVMSFIANFIMLAPLGITNFLDIIPCVAETTKGPFSLCLYWLLNFGLIFIISVVIIVLTNVFCHMDGDAENDKDLCMVFVFFQLIIAIIFVVGTVFFINKTSFYGNWSNWITHINLYGFKLGA